MKSKDVSPPHHSHGRPRMESRPLARARSCRALYLILASAIPVLTLRAEPGPGDVFREYSWSNNGSWQRITAPNATSETAKTFLPNAVNTIDLADLAGATRAEVQLELLQSHAGTTGQSLRLNGGEWIPVPASKHIPGKAASEVGPPELWQTMRYPSVEAPLSALKQGRNTFEFTCRPGTGLSARWPQSIVYGVIFRVYYGPDKPAPTGRVFAPIGTPGRIGTIELVAEPTATPGHTVRRIDFLARYHGYDWRGEGVLDRWHYHTLFGKLRQHAGSAFAAPWKVAWDARNVPAQERPVQIAARIEDDTGLIRFTDPVTLEKFGGMPDTRLYVAHDVPPHWQTRAGRSNACKITLPDDLAGLQEARLILATWCGEHADAIAINDTLLMRNIGYTHDLSYDEVTVPISALKPGVNEFSTKSATKHHGIEVLWPGAVIVARFAPPNAAH